MKKKIRFYIEIPLHASQNAIDLLISIIFQDISSYNARHLNYNYKLFVVFRIGNIHFISSVEMCSLSNSSVQCGPTWLEYSYQCYLWNQCLSRSIFWCTPIIISVGDFGIILLQIRELYDALRIAQLVLFLFFWLYTQYSIRIRWNMIYLTTYTERMARRRNFRAH